jgi:hypothetical protein
MGIRRIYLMKGRTQGKKIPVPSLLIIIILLSLLFPCFFVYSTSATGSTYYVSTSGSDSNTGSLAQPWKTIQKAANTVTQGDTVYIRGGTYNEKITLADVQGTSNSWITFAPYNNEEVTVDGNSKGGIYDGIFLFQDGCSYIRITGLELKRTTSHGIFLHGGEINHIRIDHCIIHDCESSGIYCYSGSQPTKYVRYIEFDYNTVYDVNNGYSYDDTYTISPQEAISFSNVQGFNIHHNTLTSYGKEGIDAKSGSSNGAIHHNTISTSLASPAFQWNYNHIGIYIDGFSNKNQDISVYCNTITGYGGPGIVIGAERPETGSIENISIYNNIIALSYLPGHISFRAIDSCYDAPFTDIFIYSNTIYNGDSSNSPIRIFPSTTHITNLIIANNIVTGTAYYLLSFQELRSTETASRLTLTNNLYYRFGGTGHNQWKDGTDKSWGTDYILNDPKYINRNNFNLNLQSNSPAIDSGDMSTAAPNDFEGIIRPQGNDVDIGGYEYYQQNSDITPPVISNIQMCTSTPLDVVNGWENISCSASDNVAINEVTLIFIDTNYQTTTHTMIHKTGTTIYYYNTSIKQSGNYTYHISAEDTSNNEVSSNTMKLSLPPNWDINNDGRYTILDKVLISVCYGQTGSPGWIREDINNNGNVNMADLTYDSNHYNECWWN